MPDLKKPDPRQRELYRQQNLEAARIILADPARYPGLMQEIAGRVVENHEINLAAQRRVAARENLARMEKDAW